MCGSPARPKLFHRNVSGNGGEGIGRMPLLGIPHARLLGIPHALLLGIFA
jgi:hypothetical protein